MKLFQNIKQHDGRRKIYFLGIKILSYKKKNNKVFESYSYFTKFFGLNPIEYARSIGVKVGDNCRFIVHPHPWNLPDFGSEPFLIEIGNDVCISFGCTFLTHDASMHVCKKYLPGIDVSKYGKIKIGNNVFIGCNTTILPKVSIGNDCIIGAGSVVTKNVPDGEVWAGAPAEFIAKTIDYSQKIKLISLSPEQEELKNIVKNKRC